MSSPIYINDEDPGVEISDVHWRHADLHGAAGTGRSDTTCVMKIDRIGSARTLVVDVAPNQGVAAVSRLLKLISPVKFYVTYFDRVDGDWRRDKFYAADRSIDTLVWPENLIPGVSTDFSGIKYDAFTLEFIEEGQPEGGEA